ncbi:hypothetical protein FI667_g8221, partial [Globisporangium splendens]
MIQESKAKREQQVGKHTTSRRNETAARRPLDAEPAVFNINVPELFSLAPAAILFGPSRNPHNRSQATHVQASIDNTTAMSWSNKLPSGNPIAQELLIAIGLAEAIYDFRVSLSHMPGNTNAMADVGSRSWTEPNKSTWTDLPSMNPHGGNGHLPPE